MNTFDKGWMIFNIAITIINFFNGLRLDSEKDIEGTRIVLGSSFVCMILIFIIVILKST